MSRFRKSEAREVPVLNTAALPDLIFTILFFFMIVTNMRPVPVMTQFDLPQATELQKLEEKSSVIYIMVGNPHDPANENKIQLNSEFVSIKEMSFLLEKEIQKNSEGNADPFVVVLKADKDTPMRIINEIKENLRNAGLLTVHYSAERKNIN
ncbi:MAG: biopolymer transporter ExbD [Bacteroidales bacterium]|nr:biopolymer transporter ExbD [Bacteroidales bacterium]